ncbi:MAG TPA: hypothetical protein VFA77_07260 [Candidatus Eisenbacteria bacterium]|jgi:hypothetical protein|nr:hypothetical protein [Candidatus Eisenbacteria bacterium]
MEATHWIAQHWFDLVQTAGIISGFLFTAHTIRKESEARKIANMIAMADHHHSLWKEFYKHPELSRIIDEGAALDAKPVTAEEQLFVTSLILHLDGVHRAMKAKMFVRLEGLQKDIQTFFSLPIPKAVWEKSKSLQDADFVAFVEACRNWK